MNSSRDIVGRLDYWSTLYIVSLDILMKFIERTITIIAVFVESILEPSGGC